MDSPTGPARTELSAGGSNATAGNVRLPHLPNGKVPDALSAVALKAMANNAGERYQSVLELQADIEAYQAGFATTAENAGAVKQALLLFKRQRYILGALLALSAMLAVFTLQLVRERHTTAQTLSHLRAAAPALVYQARQLLAHGETR